MQHHLRFHQKVVRYCFKASLWTVLVKTIIADVTFSKADSAIYIVLLIWGGGGGGGQWDVAKVFLLASSFASASLRTQNFQDRSDHSSKYTTHTHFTQPNIGKRNTTV